MIPSRYSRPSSTSAVDDSMPVDLTGDAFFHVKQE